VCARPQLLSSERPAGGLFVLLPILRVTGIEPRTGEVIEDALAVSTAVAFAPGAVMIAPGTDVLTLAVGLLERPVFPAARMDRSGTGFGVEELAQMRENRHG